MLGFRALCVSLLVLVSCSRQAPIRIGLLASLSGRHYDLGVSVRDGAILAADKVNASGGIQGRKIEFVVRDDRQDPAVARSQMDAFLRDGVAAVIGPVTSSMAEAVLPIAGRQGMLVLSPTASAPSLANRNDHFIMMHRSSVAARSLADSIAKDGRIRRVVAVQDLSNQAYTQPWRDEFQVELRKKGGDVFRTVTFTSGAASSFGTLAQEALADSPEGILLLASALDTAALAQQIRKRSPTPILGAEWGFTREILESGGSAVEGARFVRSVNLEEPSPALTAFADAYRVRFQREADFAAVISADAVRVLCEALSRKSPRQGLREVMVGRTYQGLDGPFSIGQDGVVERRSYLVTIHGGKMVKVE